jgi:hypothetical protein
MKENRDERNLRRRFSRASWSSILLRCQTASKAPLKLTKRMLNQVSKHFAKDDGDGGLELDVHEDLGKVIETQPDLKLCEFCRHIFDNWSQHNNHQFAKIPHCKDLFALEASAADGCALCAQFLLGRYFPSPSDFTDAKDEMIRLVQEGGKPLPGYVRIDSHSSNGSLPASYQQSSVSDGSNLVVPRSPKQKWKVL